MPAVEVLSTGGPVRGVGSPAEGDFYTRDELENIAAANRALAAQIKPPNKIGHSDAQSLVRNSALAVPTPGEMPAVGWLDGSTARVIDGKDGVDAVLVMDAKAVPHKFSQLVDVGAYRTRSVELSRITDQVTQKTYDWVVTGLAWLGAKLPAVQTLDDVVALYERAELDPPEDVRAYVVYAAAEGAVVWTPDSSFQALRDEVSQALNGGPTGGMIEPRFWVQDISVGADRALAHDYYGGDSVGYVIPFTRNADGSISISPSSDWQTVEEGWVAAAKEYARKNERAAESRSPMPEITLTDEQAAALREQLNVEGDVTPETLVEAATARANELAAAKTKAEETETRLNEAGDATTKVAELEKRVETSERKLFEAERDTTITTALREGRIDPADREKWEKRYESLGAEPTTELLSELPVNEDFSREFGSDEHGADDADGHSKEYAVEIARNAGVPVEQLI